MLFIISTLVLFALGYFAGMATKWIATAVVMG
jgi:hypothetical protein